MKNIYRLTLSLAFGFAGLAAAHGATNDPFDNGVPPIGVQLMVDEVTSGRNDTYWERPRRQPFGPPIPVDMTSGDPITLNFRAIGLYYNWLTTVVVSFASATETLVSCGIDGRMLKFHNRSGGSVSPSVLCLPKGLKRLEILVKFRSGPYNYAWGHHSSYPFGSSLEVLDRSMLAEFRLTVTPL